MHNLFTPHCHAEVCVATEVSLNAAAVRRAALPVLLMAVTVIVAAKAVQRRIFPVQATAVFVSRFICSAS